MLLFALLMYSCSEPETEKKPTAEPENPPPQPPTELCAPNVLHGYCNKISYLPGESLTAFLQARNPMTSCVLAVYNFRGDVVMTVAASLIRQTLGTDPAKNGFGYKPSVTFTVPDLPSGIYTVEKTIPFIVKPIGHTDLIIVYPSNTANAYNESGGKSLYTSDRPNAVSFHRPTSLQTFSEFCLAYLQELNEFEVGFIADHDLDEYTEIAKGKVLVIVGHNEYWTRQARLNFDRYVNEGKHALILSGNTMWWQVRYSKDADRSQMICYKSFDHDPETNPLLKTYLWNFADLQYPIVKSIGADFEKGGYGLRNDKGWDGFKILSSASPLLEGLGLQEGDVLHCPTVEYDGAPIRESGDPDSPELDLDAMKVHKAELIGYDHGYRGKETIGTFIVFQRSPASGIIINTGSTDWCSFRGMGGESSEDIRAITRNSIHKLIQNETVFSD